MSGYQVASLPHAPAVRSPRLDLRARVQHSRTARCEAERSKRLNTLIEGPLEPAHSLLELCCSQNESRTLRYIAPDRCLSRVHEITHGKTPPKQVELEADKLIVREKNAAPDMAARTALHEEARVGLSIC